MTPGQGREEASASRPSHFLGPPGRAATSVRSRISPERCKSYGTAHRDIFADAVVADSGRLYGLVPTACLSFLCVWVPSRPQPQCMPPTRHVKCHCDDCPRHFHTRVTSTNAIRSRHFHTHTVYLVSWLLLLKFSSGHIKRLTFK
jgi:hypothetical protein